MQCILELSTAVPQQFSQFETHMVVGHVGSKRSRYGPD